MQHNSDWRFDLERGKRGESFVASVFEKIDKIEVKTDFLTTDTGNLFVEFESRGKPSGLATTEADTWAFKIEPSGAIILWETKKLKEFCATHPLRIVCGGDSDTSRGYLVPVKDVIAFKPSCG
jgi:hypothetical protein